MPKISDAYVQFSARGLKELTKEIENAGSNVNKLKNVGKSSRGFFSESIVKDIGNLKRLIDQFDKVKGASAKAMADLRRVKAQTQATAIESSFAADRARTSKSAKLAARERIASISTRATAASPIAIEAEKLARNQRNKEARNNRDALAARIAADATTSASFKARASAVSGIAVTAGMSPDDLRKQADDLRTLSASLSRFSRGGAKSARDDMRSLADEIEAAADAAERLVAIEKLAKGLSPERKGQIRGQVLDELGAESRAEAISGRQAGRDIRSESPRRRAGRRIDEIDERTDLTDPQANQEISIAANEVADAMRKLASEIRESPIDEALAEAARKLKSGSISEDDFLAQETSSRFKRAGSERAEGTIDSIRLKAKTGNSGRATDTKAEIDALTARRDELAASSKNLNAAELKLNETERSLLGTEIKLKTAQLGLIKELDNHEEHVKKLLTTKAELDSKVASGVKLSKAEERARKENSNEIEVAARKEKELNSALTGTNGRLHDAAGASRNWNFKLQQLSYGVQDFVQVIGQTGLSGALRASANNMASFFAASGTPGGAIFGAVGTIAMIGIADAISAMGNEAESSADKFDRLAKAIEDAGEAKKRSVLFAGEQAAAETGRGLDLSLFANRSKDLVDNQLKTKQEIASASTAADTVLGDFGPADPGMGEGGKVLHNIKELWRDTFGSLMTGAFNTDDLARKRLSGENGTRKTEAELERQRDAAKIRLKYNEESSSFGGSEEEVQNRIREGNQSLDRKFDEARRALVDTDLATEEGRAELAAYLDRENEKLAEHKSKITALYSENQSIIRESQDALETSLNQIEKFVSDTIDDISEGSSDAAEAATDSLQKAVEDSIARRAALKAQSEAAHFTDEQRTESSNAAGRETILIEKLMDGFSKIMNAQGNKDSVSFTPIEGLYKKIQDSLSNEKSNDESIQKRHTELLERIAASTEKASDEQESGVFPAGENPTGATGQFSVPAPKFNYSGENPLEPTSASLADIYRGNQESREQRRPYTGKPTEDSISAARRNVQMQGYSGKTHSDESFYGARRAGTVSDAPAARRGVVDEMSRGRPGRGGFIAPDSVGAQAGIPEGETPEQNRKRRVAARASEFGEMSQAGPALNSRTIKTAIATMKPVFDAGPAMTSEGAAKLRKEREAAAGPAITRENARQLGGKINPNFYAATDSSNSYSRKFDFSEKSREAEGAGIPLSVPDAGISRKGPRTLAKEAETRRIGEEARAAKIAEIDKAKSEREAIIAERKRTKEKAEQYLESRRNIGPDGLPATTSKNVSAVRSARELAGKEPSFMQQFEAGDKTGGLFEDKNPLESNVDTKAENASSKANQEALKYQKRTSDNLDKMLKIMENKSSSGALIN